jgi:hypothetical protein
MPLKTEGSRTQTSGVLHRRHTNRREQGDLNTAGRLVARMAARGAGRMDLIGPAEASLDRTSSQRQLCVLES